MSQITTMVNKKGYPAPRRSTRSSTTNKQGVANTTTTTNVTPQDHRPSLQDTGTEGQDDEVTRTEQTSTMPRLETFNSSTIQQNHNGRNGNIEDEEQSASSKTSSVASSVTDSINSSANRTGTSSTFTTGRNMNVDLSTTPFLNGLHDQGMGTNRLSGEPDVLSYSEVMRHYKDPSLEIGMSVAQKKKLVYSAYKLLRPIEFTNEQLRSVTEIVNTHIVSKVKFVKNEFLRLKTKKEKENARKYPSFWNPDLADVKNNVAKDVLSRIPQLRSVSIVVWAATWMGISNKVLEKIRYNRNSLHNYLKPIVLKGE